MGYKVIYILAANFWKIKYFKILFVITFKHKDKFNKMLQDLYTENYY